MLLVGCGGSNSSEHLFFLAVESMFVKEQSLLGTYE